MIDQLTLNLMWSAVVTFNPYNIYLQQAVMANSAVFYANFYGNFSIPSKHSIFFRLFFFVSHELVINAQMRILNYSLHVSVDLTCK